MKRFLLLALALGAGAVFGQARAAAQGRPPMYLELRGGPTIQGGADFVNGSSYWQLEKEGADMGKYVDKPIDAVSPSLAFAVPIEGKFHIGLLAPSGRFGGLEMTLRSLSPTRSPTPGERV